MSDSKNLSLDIGDELGESEGNAKPQPRPKPWKDVLQQVIAAFAMNLHSVSVGAALAFPTVVLLDVRGVQSGRELSEEQDSIEDEGKMLHDDDQASWYGSISVTSVLLGSLVASAFQPRFGRRTVLIVANIFLATAWSLSSVAQQPTLVLASTVLASLYAGSLVAPLLVYQSETLSPRYLRTPFLLSVTHISLVLGLTTEMALGAMLDWRTVAAINTVFPATCLVILLTMSESSAVLGRREGNSEFAAVSRWLRGNPRTEAEEQKRGSVDAVSRPSSFSRRTPQLRSVALLVASLCYHHLSGMTALRTYSVPLLGMLSKELPSYVNAFPLILGCFQICGVALGLVFRGWTGRSCRLSLLLASFLGSVGCSLALGLYSHFFIHKLSPPHPDISISSPIPFWLPTGLLGIFTFCSCMSIPLVPYTFAGEFFPSFAVGFSSRLALFLSCACCFLCNKLFFLTINFVGLRGLFWIYSATGSICSGAIFALLPRDFGENNDEKSTKNPWHEMDEDLVETWVENSSVTNSVEKVNASTESTGDGEDSCNRSNAKETRSEGRIIKLERRNFERTAPDWLGDISWAGRHGGWLVEETKRGGWRVVERGQRHQGGGGRSMDVERGTWIGHMLQVVTTAANTEESKDFSKWKLANRTRKRWAIMRGPNNQWQICSAPWESDTSEESEDESDSADESDSSNASSYSDQNSTSMMSDENRSTGRNCGEVLCDNGIEGRDKSNRGTHYSTSIHRNSLGEYVSKNNPKDNLKVYRRSYSTGACDNFEKS